MALGEIICCETFLTVPACVQEAHKLYQFSIKLDSMSRKKDMI